MVCSFMNRDNFTFTVKTIYKILSVEHRNDFSLCKGKILQYSITCVNRPLSERPQISFQDQLSLNAGQKYCRKLQGEHSAILSTFIKLPFGIKIFVLSIFEWPLYTGFTIH